MSSVSVGPHFGRSFRQELNECGRHDRGEKSRKVPSDEERFMAARIELGAVLAAALLAVLAAFAPDMLGSGRGPRVGDKVAFEDRAGGPEVWYVTGWARDGRLVICRSKDVRRGATKDM